MSTWRRHRAHRNIRASSIAAPDGEGWTIRNHRAILRSEPYASADLGAASDVTRQSIQSEAALVSPAPAISPQRHSAVIAPAHGDGISGNIGSGGKHVLGGVAGTIQCVLGRPSRITSRPVLHHLSALFGRREHTVLALDEPLSFRGGVDPATGVIVDRHHPQADASVAGTVLVLPGDAHASFRTGEVVTIATGGRITRS